MPVLWMTAAAPGRARACWDSCGENAPPGAPRRPVSTTPARERKTVGAPRLHGEVGKGRAERRVRPTRTVRTMTARGMEQQHRHTAVDDVAASTIMAAHRRDHQHELPGHNCHPHGVEV